VPRTRREAERAPATAGELKALRRWLRVAAVWATVATAVAGFALYVALEVREGEDEAVTTAERRIIRLGRTLDTRLDRFESRLRSVPRASDIKRLESRLERVETRAVAAEDDAQAAADRADRLERSLTRLRGQVEDADAAPSGGGADQPEP